MVRVVNAIHSHSDIRRALIAWFRAHSRDLPWRRTCDPYHIWVSEIMLQQTRVETVIPYYERFLAVFPSVRALAAATEDEVLKAWEGMGYYGRARNLLRAARTIVYERGGRFPQTADEWRELPGVGEYTAAGIASMAYDEPRIALDGNAKRVLMRLFGIRGRPDDTQVMARLRVIGGELVPRRSPGRFNQALMELGATICLPKQPRCATCPIRRFCETYHLGLQDEIPAPRKRRPLPHHHIVAAAILRNGRYLLGKRPQNVLLGGLWEFPGGKVELGETHEQAVVREIEEELGVTVSAVRYLDSVDHAYSHFAITLHLYLCDLVNGRPKARFHDEVRWVSRSKIGDLALPAATRKLLSSLPTRNPRL